MFTPSEEGVGVVEAVFFAITLHSVVILSVDVF